MRWLLIISVSLLSYGFYQQYNQRVVNHPVGSMTAPQDPQQSKTDAAQFLYKDYKIKSLANFSIKARVISTEHYWSGRESDLSPVDLALGWGPMSDTAVISQLHISQSNRFYFWRYDNTPPIEHDQIISHSANMHMIPATEEIKKNLMSVRPGQIVSFSGYLVEVKGSDGWFWRSSLSRDDSGAGACEVVWVKEIQVSDI